MALQVRHMLCPEAVFIRATAVDKVDTSPVQAPTQRQNQIQAVRRPVRPSRPAGSAAWPAGSAARRAAGHARTQLRSDVLQRDARVRQVDAPQARADDVVPQARHQVGGLVGRERRAVLLRDAPARQQPPVV
jgi:hypothetical protein